MKVLSTMHRYDPGRGPFRAWLYRIASNAAIDRLRSDSRNHPVHGETMDDIAASGPGPEGHLAALEAEQHLTRLLAGIGVKQRNAILLRHQLGFTYAEVGSILGVAENTAKTLVHRGILALRRRPEVSP